MRVKINDINKLIKKTWSGDTVITELQYFPKFEYVDGKFVQQECYQVKYNGQKPTWELSVILKKYFRIELVWEEDIIPLIPYTEKFEL